MQRARMKASREVEYVRLARDLRGKTGDFFVINEDSQFVFTPDEFERKFELTTDSFKAPERKRSQSKRKRRSSPGFTIYNSQVEQLVEAVGILYDEQVKDFSIDQLLDPNFCKGINFNTLFESGLIQDCPEFLTETPNHNIYLKRRMHGWIELAMKRKLLQRDKFRGKNSIGKIVVCWHYRPA